MLKKEWELKKIKNKSKINQDFKNISSVILKVLAQRNIYKKKDIETFLSPQYEQLLDPFLFTQMKKAVQRIKKARKNKEKVLIFGDYDADGITSSAILKIVLDDLGLESEVYIPDKEKEGYGINWQAVKKYLDKNFNLIITVDCGISNFQEVKKINQAGGEIIITDHHHIPSKIPDALAILNPQLEKQKEKGYPFSELAGVGVTFKFAQALYQKLLPEKEEQLKWLLDLVAIGTVADCVPLLKENRILVKYGLIVLSKTRRKGLQKMLQVGRIKIDENNFPTTEKISFQIAPRLNAAGRMKHARWAFELIFSQDLVQAHNLALEIETQNQARQKITQQIVKEIKIIAQNSFQQKSFIFVANQHYPIGIVGLIAGQIADYFQKPTAVLHKKEKISVGSFRSIPGVNIINLIEKLDYLLERFGGHSQAAGITIQNKNLEEFYEKLNKLIEQEIQKKKTKPILEIDLELLPKDIDYQLAQDLQKLEPFGEGNPEPIFLTRKLKIESLRWLGNGEKHLKLYLSNSLLKNKLLEAIGFNMNDKFQNLKSGEEIDLVYNLHTNNWNNETRIQLRIIDIKKSKD